MMIRTPPNQAPGGTDGNAADGDEEIAGATALTPPGQPTEEGNTSAHSSGRETVLDRLRSSAEKLKSASKQGKATASGPALGKPERKQPTRSTTTASKGVSTQPEINAAVKQAKQTKTGKPPPTAEEKELRDRMPRHEDQMTILATQAREILNEPHPSPKKCKAVSEKMYSAVVNLKMVYTQIQRLMRERGIGGQPVNRYDDLMSGLRNTEQLAQQLEQAAVKKTQPHHDKPATQQQSLFGNIGDIQDVHIPPLPRHQSTRNKTPLTHRGPDPKHQGAIPKIRPGRLMTLAELEFQSRYDEAIHRQNQRNSPAEKYRDNDFSSEDSVLSIPQSRRRSRKSSASSLVDGMKNLTIHEQNQRNLANKEVPFEAHKRANAAPLRSKTVENWSEDDREVPFRKLRRSHAAPPTRLLARDQPMVVGEVPLASSGNAGAAPPTRTTPGSAPTAQQSSNTAGATIDSSTAAQSDQEAPDAFYHSLPAPWNVVPHSPATPSDDYIKYVQKGRVIMFDGKIASYSQWRDKFIQSFHVKRTSPSNKALALQASLDTKVQYLNLLATTTLATAEGYKALIEELEAQYGGKHRMRQEKLQQLLATPMVKVGNLSALQEYYHKLKSFVSVLDSDGRAMSHSEEDSNYFLSASRLDTQLGLRYTDWLTSDNHPASLASLLLFAQKELARWRRLNDLSSQFLDRPASTRHARTFVARGGESDDEDFSFKTQEEPPDCDACEGQHLLKHCPAFLAMTPQQRLELMTEKKRCYKCLRIGHGANTCLSSAKCQHCDRRHHTLLHGASMRRTAQPPKEQGYRADIKQDFDEEIPIKITEKTFAAGEAGTISLGTVPICLQNQKKSIEINALLDTGNTTSLLSEDAAKALGLTGYQEVATIEGVGGRLVESKIKAQVVLRTDDGKVNEKLWVRVVPKPAGSLRAVNWNDHKAKFPHLRDIQFPEPCERRVVDLILGNSVAKLMSSETGDVCGPKPDDPIARKTPLGWVAAGKLDPAAQTEDAKQFLSFFMKERHDPRVCEPSHEVRKIISSPHSAVNYGFLVPEEGKKVKLKCCPSPESQKLQELMASLSDTTQSDRGYATVPSEDPGTPLKLSTGRVGMFSGGATDHGPGTPHAFPEEADEVRGGATDSDPGTPHNEATSNIGCTETLKQAHDDTLTKLVEQQWEIEETAEDEDKALSKEEQRALELLRTKGSYAANGGGVTMPCLWREGEPNLPYNYHEARKMYQRRLLTKMMRDPVARESYNKPLENYKKKGYFEERPLGSGKFYLDHFPVLKEDKVSSKVRPVFNGALKFHGKCLNDSILPGPKMINDIPDVLMHFRRERICLSCDIKEMFLNIRLLPEDQPYHHFLWSSTGEPGDIKDYAWTRHLFGNAGSPCVAIYTIKNHAKERQKQYPVGSPIVIKCTIVDDNLTSDATTPKVLKMIEELKALYGEMSMVVCKFMSNSDEVMDSLKEDEKAPNIDLTELQSSAMTTPTLKALGVFYSRKDDAFSFKKDVPMDKEVWNKRDILSFYASLFDPHGLISPVVIMARIIFQGLWLRDYGWDDPIQDQELMEWLCWLDGVTDFPKFRIPRCLFDTTIQSPVTKKELHVFCDASTKAFAAAVYLLCVFDNGHASSRLVQSRAKLAPIKSVSVPRLELMAAVLGKELAHKCSTVQESANIHFWTDSMNVLCWLRTASRQLHTFVANRVAKIQRATSVDSWHWLPSESNPADIASRGALPDELIPSNLWWHGPTDLMTMPPTTAPTLRPTTETESELKRGELFSFQSEEGSLALDPNQKGGAPFRGTLDAREGGALSCGTPVHEAKVLDESRFSSWPKMVRTQAFCQRFHDNLMAHWKDSQATRTAVSVSHQRTGRRNQIVNTQYNPPLKDCCPPISAQEYQQSETKLLQICQAEALQQDVDDLQSHGAVKPRSPLVRLRPFLDGTGTVRMGGRLRLSAHLPFDAKCPILLPKSHPVTKMIVWHYHADINKHVGGVNHTLSSLSDRFWLIGGRQEVKHVLSTCTKCRRVNAKIKHQEEAPLPDCRFYPSQSRVAPFHTTGVDAAGPFSVTLGRSSRKNAAEHKRYVIIFTCAVYRCVHFELVETLEADSFLMALSRFLARRPRPEVIISDNGGNFQRSATVMSQLYEHLQTNLEKLSRQHPTIAWRFNTPLSPHQGGFFERLVGSMKRALNVTLPTAGKLKEEELQTCVVITEGILNSRPLAYVGTDPNDLTPLTPAHFLLQKPYTDVAMTTEDHTIPKLVKRWHHLQTIMDRLWSRFVKEVMPQLQPMNKWTTKRRDLQVGDVCVLFEEKLRGVWPLAIITEIIPHAGDGHARRAKIRCNGRLLERSLSRLLVIQENQD